MEEDEQLRSHVLKSMVKVSRSVGDSSDSQKPLCVICLDGISEVARTRPCAHDFDFLCIVNWLERNPTCPLCKTRVRTVEYDRQSWPDVKVYNLECRPPLSSVNTALSPTSNSPSTSHHVQQAQLEQYPQTHASHASPVTVDALAHRKHVYHYQLYSLHVGSNGLSRFQELSPKRFTHDAELVSRARKWIRRELRVFDFLASPAQTSTTRGPVARRVNVEYILEWIIAMLKSVDIKGSNGQAEDMLREYLGRDNARLFLHELRAWLRSPFLELQQWDRTVQYNETSDPLRYIDASIPKREKKRRRDRDIEYYAPSRPRHR